MLGWVYHPQFLTHCTGLMHPERPERLTAAVEALEEAGLIGEMTALEFAAASPESLYGVHDPAYVALVKESCEAGAPFIGSKETRICRASYDIALLAVGGVLAACDAAISGHVLRSFCAVRPPGHHAEPDLAMGFCLFNNIAVAADHLVRKHGLSRVAIVDFDVHHGNGTQVAFETRSDVLFISIHEDPLHLFPGTGYESETGHGKGRGFTVNVPMPPGSDDLAYRKAFAEKIMPRLYQFKPEFLLVDAGFDAVADDPVSHINLVPASYTWITQQLSGVAESCCGGKMVSVFEGGYELNTLRQSVVAHVRALLNGALAHP